MSKSRLNYKHLSRLAPTSGRTTYKDTLVWKWLHFVTAGSDETGDAIRALRKRVDMPNQFPHRSYLHNYVAKCRQLDPALVERVYQHLWNMYAEYRDVVIKNPAPTGQTPSRNPWDERKGRQFKDVTRETNELINDSKFLSR